MEHKLWPFQKMQIPDSNETIWFIQCGRVFVIRRDAQFGVLMIKVRTFVKLNVR